MLIAEPEFAENLLSFGKLQNLKQMTDHGLRLFGY